MHQNSGIKYTYKTVIEAVLAHAEHKPDEVGFKFRKSDKIDTITWLQLATRAKTLANKISNNTNPGDRALLIYEPGLEFICAFLASSIARVIAVPCYPPSNTKLNSKLEAIITDAQPTLVLHDNNTQTPNHIPSIDTTLVMTHPTFSIKNLPKEDDIAFLQYSSGSTGEPKGVMVSQSNIVANIHHIMAVCGTNETCRGLSWMPHTHDMGLIGHILHTAYGGGYLCIIPPSQMVRHPFSVFSLLEEEKLSFLGISNFAFELCINRIKPEQIAQLNLTHLHAITIGAEPIDPTVLSTFAEKFASTGLKSSMFVPAYGLAEATLMASAQKGLKTRVFKRQEVVSCGKAVETLKIVCADTKRECVDGEIGEIWLSGESIGKGYWNKRELSKELFSAQIRPDLSKDQQTLGTDEQFYLRTGDLGAIYDEDLYILGRIKEMMIFSGEKYFPKDIEAVVLSADARLEQQDCVVFSMNNSGTEELVAIVKTAHHTDKTLLKIYSASIRTTLLQKLQLAIKDIVFVTNPMPRTTSGKKQRVYCRELYISQQLDSYFDYALQKSDHDLNPLVRFIAKKISDVSLIPIEELHADEPIKDLGLSSFMMAETSAAIKEAYGVSVSYLDIEKGASIGYLAKRLAQQDYELSA